MAASTGRMVPRTCVICGQDNTRPEEASDFLACPACLLALVCVRNGIPTEVSPAVRAALEAL